MGKLVGVCEQHDVTCENSFEARDEGYYALHIYAVKEFEIPKLDWNTEKKNISIEFQITTQLQDVIGNLTHWHYERRRMGTKSREKKWQWDYKSEEFTTNYLGHILHYVEGMIMEVRENQSKRKIK